MPERYNFVTENFEDRKKGISIVNELQEFANHVLLHEFNRYGGGVGYFISGQSVEVDSNAGCIELTTCLQVAGIAAVFINDPAEYGVILKKEA